MSVTSEASSRKRYPGRGAALGLACGAALLPFATSDPYLHLETWKMVSVHLVGGMLGGFVGGLLWPYQRSRLQTMLFAIPSATPIYVLAAMAMNLPAWLGLVVAILSGTFYAMLYGGGFRGDTS